MGSSRRIRLVLVLACLLALSGCGSSNETEKRLCAIALGQSNQAASSAFNLMVNHGGLGATEDAMAEVADDLEEISRETDDAELRDAIGELGEAWGDLYNAQDEQRREDVFIRIGVAGGVASQACQNY